MKAFGLNGMTSGKGIAGSTLCLLAAGNQEAFTQNLDTIANRLGITEPGALIGFRLGIIFDMARYQATIAQVISFLEADQSSIHKVPKFCKPSFEIAELAAIRSYCHFRRYLRSGGISELQDAVDELRQARHWEMTGTKYVYDSKDMLLLAPVLTKRYFDRHQSQSPDLNHEVESLRGHDAKRYLEEGIYLVDPGWSQFQNVWDPTLDQSLARRALTIAGLYCFEASEFSADPDDFQSFAAVLDRRHKVSRDSDDRVLAEEYGKSAVRIKDAGSEVRGCALHYDHLAASYLTRYEHSKNPKDSHNAAMYHLHAHLNSKNLTTNDPLHDILRFQGPHIHSILASEDSDFTLKFGDYLLAEASLPEDSQFYVLINQIRFCNQQHLPAIRVSERPQHAEEYIIAASRLPDSCKQRNLLDFHLQASKAYFRRATYHHDSTDLDSSIHHSKLALEINPHDKLAHRQAFLTYAWRHRDSGKQEDLKLAIFHHRFANADEGDGVLGQLLIPRGLDENSDPTTKAVGSPVDDIEISRSSAHAPTAGDTSSRATSVLNNFRNFLPSSNKQNTDRTNISLSNAL